MLGQHCIKTWSSTQEAYALSSADAELYAMVKAATRAKGLTSLVKELGYANLEQRICLHTDSSAAKSFVSKHALGKMRLVQIRDLLLQREVREGKVLLMKIRGEDNPADLLTKIIQTKDIVRKLQMVNIEYVSEYFADQVTEGILEVRLEWDMCRSRRDRWIPYWHLPDCGEHFDD